MINIPNFGDFEIKNIVFDYNGTLAKDGKISKEIKESLKKISEKFNIYVITSDTFGSAQKELLNLPIKLYILTSANHTEEKSKFVKKLKNVIAVGNGNNDSLMLKESDIGICVINEEGASNKALLNSDLICKSITDAIELIKNPKRIIATLRM